MVHLNPYLCPSKIRPLEDYIRHWSNNDSSRHIDISDSTNGNSAACESGGRGGVDINCCNTGNQWGG